MTDFKREINLEEERKEDLNSSVSNEIYNSEYQMVDFPAQSFQTIKNFEEKISTYCKYMETCQKVYRSLLMLYSLFLLLCILLNSESY